MIKYGLNPSVLPPGSTIINKPASIFDESGTIILVFLLIIFLTAVIIAHVVFLKKKYQVEYKVLKSREELETLVEIKTHELEHVSKELITTQRKLLEYIQFLTSREKDLQKSEENLET